MPLKGRETAGIAQLVRASDCDSEGRGFEPHYSPGKMKASDSEAFSVMNFYVYILQSEKDQSFYIGQTNDLMERLRRHSRGLENIPTKKCLEKYFGRQKFLREERQ